MVHRKVFRRIIIGQCESKSAQSITNNMKGNKPILLEEEQWQSIVIGQKCEQHISCTFSSRRMRKKHPFTHNKHYERKSAKSRSCTSSFKSQASSS